MIITAYQHDGGCDCAWQMNMGKKQYNVMVSLNWKLIHQSSIPQLCAAMKTDTSYSLLTKNPHTIERTLPNMQEIEYRTKHNTGMQLAVVYFAKVRMFGKLFKIYTQVCNCHIQIKQQHYTHTIIQTSHLHPNFYSSMHIATGKYYCFESVPVCYTIKPQPLQLHKYLQSAVTSRGNNYR